MNTNEFTTLPNQPPNIKKKHKQAKSERLGKFGMAKRTTIVPFKPVKLFT